MRGGRWRAVGEVLNLPWHLADRERMTPKVKGTLIQVVSVAVVLLGVVFALGLWFMNNENSGLAILVIGVALLVAGGRLYRWGAKVRNPDWKPSKSFHLSR
jgi:hypothetical protein